MSTKESPHLEEISNSLKGIIDKLLTGKADLKYTQDPEIQEKDIIEYESRMRIFGMEKFNAPCYGSCVNYYSSDQSKESHDSIGALVIFCERENTPKLLKALGYRGFSEEEDDEILEQLSNFAREVSAELEKNLLTIGYSSVVASEPAPFLNDISEGVEFSYDEYRFRELVFYLWKEKVLVVNLTIVKS